MANTYITEFLKNGSSSAMIRDNLTDLDGMTALMHAVTP